MLWYHELSWIIMNFDWHHEWSPIIIILYYSLKTLFWHSKTCSIYTIIGLPHVRVGLLKYSMWHIIKTFSEVPSENATFEVKVKWKINLNITLWTSEYTSVWSNDLPIVFYLNSLLKNVFNCLKGQYQHSSEASFGNATRQVKVIPTHTSSYRMEPLGETWLVIVKVLQVY